MSWKPKSRDSDIWCQVLRGKYRWNGINDEVSTRQTDSSLWKAIVKIWPKLNEICCWSLGDGKSVDVWDSM